MCRLGRPRLLLNWARRQLQHRSPLPGNEVSNQSDHAIREFQSVMMLVNSVGIDLPKPGQSITDVFSKHHPVRLDVLLENDLGPGTKADCDLPIVRARKAPRPRRKIRRNQGFRDLSGRTT
jgi:hypothetical protein